MLGFDVLVLAGVPHNYPLFGPAASIGITALAAFFALGYSRLKVLRDPLPFVRFLFLLHLACVVLVSIANAVEPHRSVLLAESAGLHFVLRIVALAAVLLLALACIPLSAWRHLHRATGWLWLWSILAGGAVYSMRFLVHSSAGSSYTAIGRMLQAAAFHSVSNLLRLILPNLSVDPGSFTIGTPNFAIIIAEACSGLEGMGLILVFTVLWLWYFRRESRFPQALVLVPCALTAAWLLNILRIAALVLIGNAGAPDVAMVGFHSQAGWIAFAVVAVTFSMATQKLSWVRSDRCRLTPAASLPSAMTPSPDASVVRSPSLSQEAGESAATRAYLIPFLAILAASFVSSALSGSFEWFYPLRFIVAAGALWHYRSELRRIDWRFGWLAPLSGAFVFLLWLVAAWQMPGFAHPGSMHPVPGTPTAAALAAMPAALRFTWIAFRIAAAIVTVPIAAELAFRGYLARRLIRFSNASFDKLPFSSVTLISITLSSLIYGALQGRHWLIGFIAGFVYAGAMKWKGRLGDAVISHATTGLLLAAWVLLRGNWSLW